MAIPPRAGCGPPEAIVRMPIRGAITGYTGVTYPARATVTNPAGLRKRSRRSVEDGCVQPLRKCLTSSASRSSAA